MPQPKEPGADSPQLYDATLKGLMDDRAVEIIPHFVPEMRVIAEKNSEIKREGIRADLVYLTERHREPHILNMELQTSYDSDMPKRMLRYHVELHLAYNMPVISVVLYLFKTTIPTPPYQEMSGAKALLTLDYQAIAVWKLDAHMYVKESIICMYPFLPAMKGADTTLLKQAVSEMNQYYKQDLFGRYLKRFMIILNRSTIVSAEEKQRFREEIRMEYTYNWLLEEDPDVQEIVQRGIEKEREKIEKEREKIEEAARKEVEAARKEVEEERLRRLLDLRELLLEEVKESYPSLKEVAEEKVTQIEKPDYLRLLIKQVKKAPNEDVARSMLDAA